jgi:hypothetical protein
LPTFAFSPPSLFFHYSIIFVLSQGRTHFQQEEKILENQIKLIADRESIRIAIEQQDRGELLKILLPLRTVLNLDLIKVVDTKGKVLLDARESELVPANLLDSAVVDSVISGSTFAELVDVEGEHLSLALSINT